MLNCYGIWIKKAKYIIEYKFEYDRINRLSNRAFKSLPVHCWIVKVFVKIYFFVNEDLLANKVKGEI